ncbi:MAG: hypothetical protein J7K73_01225 [Nanoarchaeota archaeon]|nr:hypothetical protein [Nanoarchaeota archaeon]
MDCLESGNVRRGSQDKNLAKARLNMAKNKLRDARILLKNKGSIANVFTLYYDAFLETAHAIAAINGFKIYNHECITYFLKEFINESDIGSLFEECRKLRNKINYYGETLEDAVGKRLIQKITNAIKRMQQHINLEEDS